MELRQFFSLFFSHLCQTLLEEFRVSDSHLRDIPHSKSLPSILSGYAHQKLCLFYSWQLRKRHNFWWTSQTNFGPSYFVRALAIQKKGNRVGFFFENLRTKYTKFHQSRDSHLEDDCCLILFLKKCTALVEISHRFIY